MDILFSPYSLKKRNGDKQKGVLIKICHGDSWGVADLCPRLELGDDNLEFEIEKQGLLFQRSYELALEDLNARQLKKSLLQDLSLKNNLLITDYLNADLNSENYQENTLKIKGDANIRLLADKLNAIRIKVMIRLDFNSKLTADQFEQFLKLLTSDTLKRIDYIEDPTPLTENWKIWNQVVNLAYDFQNQTYQSEYAKYKIVKPARQKFDMNLNKYTFTSAMDHPVGVAHGFRIAQSLAQNDSGFLTLDLYDESRFNKYYTQTGCWLNFSKLALDDYGIGMTEELNLLSWFSKDALCKDRTSK